MITKRQERILKTILRLAGTDTKVILRTSIQDTILSGKISRWEWEPTSGVPAGLPSWIYFLPEGRSEPQKMCYCEIVEISEAR